MRLKKIGIIIMTALISCGLMITPFASETVPESILVEETAETVDHQPEDLLMDESGQADAMDRNEGEKDEATTEISAVAEEGILEEEADKNEITSDMFPDNGFRSIIQEHYDLDEDGYLSDNEINTVTSINVRWEPIYSVEGIGVFKNLKELNCSNTYVSSIDMSELKSLETLNCTMCAISTLDLSEVKGLKKLSCGTNVLTFLDVSHNTPKVV